MKSDASEFRIVLKDNPDLTEEFSQLRAGDKEVELTIKVQVSAIDENELTGFIEGAMLEKAPERKDRPHNAVELLNGGPAPGAPPTSNTVTEIEQSEISPAELLV